MNSVNHHNISADRLAHGKWATLNRDYFANPQIIREFYSFLNKLNVPFGKKIEVIDLGAAEGRVGEFFAEQLRSSRVVSLTILDIVQEHLATNHNPRTKKRCEDLLNFHDENNFDLAIMSSVLHYFSKSEQLTVLKNIKRCLKSSGVFLLKAFTQYPENMDLFHTLNRKVGKKLKLITSDELEKLLMKAGFSEVTRLGSATTWNCTSKHLKNRYKLTQGTLSEMATMIQKAKSSEKKGFTENGKEFSIPIPFKVYLLKK